LVALLCARCGVLQCVVVRFSLLQCVTACCSLTQCVRGDVRAACSWLQSVALCCSLLQSAAVQRSVLQVRYAQHVAGGSVLQYVACAAVWCSLLHSNAVCERCAMHTILLVALCCSLLHSLPKNGQILLWPNTRVVKWGARQRGPTCRSSRLSSGQVHIWGKIFAPPIPGVYRDFSQFRGLISDRL